MQTPRAVGSLPVCLSMKPVGKPNAGNRHVRFDERGWETGRRRMAQATAPILDSTDLCRHVRAMSAITGNADIQRVTLKG